MTKRYRVMRLARKRNPPSTSRHYHAVNCNDRSTCGIIPNGRFSTWEVNEGPAITCRKCRLKAYPLVPGAWFYTAARNEFGIDRLTEAQLMANKGTK
jgi:hypothetical protein